MKEICVCVVDYGVFREDDDLLLSTGGPYGRFSLRTA
jgi:hypothetical protein